MYRLLLVSMTTRNLETHLLISSTVLSVVFYSVVLFVFGTPACNRVEDMQNVFLVRTSYGHDKRQAIFLWHPINMRPLLQALSNLYTHRGPMPLGDASIVDPWSSHLLFGVQLNEGELFLAHSQCISKVPIRRDWKLTSNHSTQELPFPCWGSGQPACCSVCFL